MRSVGETSRPDWRRTPGWSVLRRFPPGRPAEFQQALADGAVAGAWSSNGAVSTDRSITLDADFIVPASGALVLPAFTEAALAWLEFRLGEPQEGMSFDDLISRIDGPTPIPLTPVMDTGRSPLIHTGIDPSRASPSSGSIGPPSPRPATT